MKFVGRIGFLPFRYHILTNSTDIVPINSFYRPVCDGLKADYRCREYVGVLYIYGLIRA